MKIYLIPTDHWDPFWVLSPAVSEKMGVRNLRKALDIIKESPDFKYVDSQVYRWELFKKYLPERVGELKQRVKEGKIVLACGGYVNPDFNIPSGESLIRQMTFGKRTWQEEFGVNPEIAWVQDSFGQPASLPQILSKMGLKFHTAKRGAKKDLPAVFLWEGVDGSRIVFDRQPLGHHGIVFMPSSIFPALSTVPNRVKPWEKLEKIINFPLFFLPLALVSLYLPDFNLWVATKGGFWRFKSALTHLKKLYTQGKVFLPHSFGFDGALPQGYITELAKFYSFISKDKMSIVSPSEFLNDLKIDESLPVVKGELNGPNKKCGEGLGTLPGTYSTRIDIKQRIRIMERSLYLAELSETLKYLNGEQYRDFSEIWKLKFLSDFHDNACGSLTDDNYKILREKGEYLISQCQSIVEDNLKILAPAEAIFNPLPWPRRGLIEKNKKWMLVLSQGLGFSPIETSNPEGRLGFNAETKSLITPFYKVEWSQNSLKIFRLIPKNEDKKVGLKITGENLARFRLQAEHGDAYFWDVSHEEWDRVQSIKVTECDAFRATLEIESRLRNLKIHQQISFFAHTPRIDFRVSLDNQEKDIRLQAHLSFNTEVKTAEITREIPAGFLSEGQSPGQAKWRDVFGTNFAYYDDIKCVQSWIYFGLEQGVAIFNDGLPEHELTKNGCFITLLRCVGRVGTKGKGFFKRFKPGNVPWKGGSPHPIPLAQLQGSHEFKYAFYPGKREDVVRECYEFLFPLQFCAGSTSSPQTTKNSSSPFSISDKNIIPLAIKKTERGGGIVVRLLETEGKEKEIGINLNPELEFKTATLANLMEEKTSDLIIENNVIKLKIKPQEIVTLVLER